MNSRFGFVQGRLSVTPKKNLLQYLPKNWESEFPIAKNLKFNFIEYFKDRKQNIHNPLKSILSAKKLERIRKKFKLKNYSICDDFFIGHNILKIKNLKKYIYNIVKILKLLNIKIYVLPLFEKSNLNEQNYIKFINIIDLFSRILKKNKIKLALETNVNSNFFFKILNCCVYKTNIFLVYDTGNRLKKKYDPFNEICDFGKKIIHVHIKDKNFKGENVLIGKGQVNFFRVFKGLKKINYKKKFVFETNRGLNPTLTMYHNFLYISKIAKHEKYKI